MKAPVDVEAIRDRQSRIVQQFGPWTTGFQIAPDLYTREDPDTIKGGGLRLRRMLQVAHDFSHQPLESLRVLDLGCLEGMFAIEFARHGAEVVGIEGREANIEKARFVKEILSLDRLQLAQDDVRNLSQEAYGTFDLVLCLGILYHLDAPDVFQFAERMAEVCRGCAIIDTHICLTPIDSRIYDGNRYWGSRYGEHAPDTRTVERLKRVWASLDNGESFWLTRPSLYNLLARAGFASIYECHYPSDGERPWKNEDRITLVAVKGERARLISTPLINELPELPRPEVNGRHSISLVRRFGRRLPGPVKEYVRRLVR